MASLPLITPSDCAVVLVDYQAGLAFAAGSADRQGIRSAALALAKTAVAFSVPVSGQHVGEQGLQRAADPAAARCPDRRITDRTPQHEPVGGRSRQGGGRGHGATHPGRRGPPDGSLRQLSGALRAGEGLPVAGRGRCLRWADAGQPLGGAAAHAAGWRCIDLVATGITRVPTRLDSPRDVRGHARDRGRARRWLWHRVGLRPRHDQAGLGDTRMDQGANLNRKNGEAKLAKFDWSTECKVCLLVRQ